MRPDPLSLARTAKHRAFVSRRSARAASEAASFRVRRRASLRRAAQEIRFLRVPRAGAEEVWGIAMVRNEQDVIAGTIEQLLSEGVDRLLIVDNGSTDGTRDLLAELAALYPVVLGDDLWPAYEQSAKMTVLSDIARGAGARWVVPFDADERWMGKAGPLAEVLRASPLPIVQAELVNAFPDPLQSGEWRLDPAPHHDPKIAFRPLPGTVVGMGNHRALRPGDIGTGLGIVHLPWRSFEQFSSKVSEGAARLAAADADSESGWHWRRLGAMDDTSLRTAWEDLLAGRPVPENAWQPTSPTVPFVFDGALLWQDVQDARRPERYTDFRNGTSEHPRGDDR
jgi:hypothetical protein